MKKDQRPFIIDTARLEEMNLDHNEDNEDRAKLRAWAERAAKGKPFLEHRPEHVDKSLTNMWLSQCFNCNDIALWLYDRMVYPPNAAKPRS